MAFNQLFPLISSEDNKDDYINLALLGGYPEARNKESNEVQQWYFDYVNSLIEHDLKYFLNIKRQHNMHELLAILAARSSKLMNTSAIGSGLSLSQQTISTYINALEALHLVERLQAWSKTDYDRVNKHDKIFMSDTGLMAAILNWNLNNIRFDGDKNGKLLETFVFTQLKAYIDAQTSKYNIYHYRDCEKREIDFIIENEAGDILGIEVKAGSAISQDSLKHLKWFKNNIAQDKKFIGIILENIR